MLWETHLKGPLRRCPRGHLFLETRLGDPDALARALLELSQMQSSQSKQPISRGLGTHFTSPIKSRDKKKTNTIIEIPGHTAKRKLLQQRLAKLKCPKPTIGLETPPASLDAQDESPFLD